MFKLKSVAYCVIFNFLLLLAGPLLAPATATAATLPNSCAQITLAFDDGMETAYTVAAKEMAKYNYPGVAYVYTQPLNEKEPGLYYEEWLDWNETVDLKNTYGWEIGAHSYSHPDLAALPYSQAQQEINRSVADLQAHGIDPKSFATPYGAYNQQIVDYLKTKFTSHRTAWGGVNDVPVADSYGLLTVSAAELTLDEIKNMIDQVALYGGWPILYFHDLTNDAQLAGQDDFYYLVDNFKQILAYIQAKNLPVVSVSQGIAATCAAPELGPNLVPNGNFEDNAGRYDPNLLTWYSSMDDLSAITNSEWFGGASVSGSLVFAPGKQGNAPVFPPAGASQARISLPAYQVLNPVEGAITFWYKPNYDSGANYRATFFKSSPTWTDGYFEFIHLEDGSLYYKIEGLYNNYITVPAGAYSWHKGEWVKLAVSWKDGGQMEVYLNGARIGLIGKDSSGNVAVKAVNLAEHYFGADLFIGSNGATDIDLNGALDEFMIFKSQNYLMAGNQYDADGWIRNPASAVKVVGSGGSRKAEIVGQSAPSMILTYAVPVSVGTAYSLGVTFEVKEYVAGDASVWLGEFGANYNYIGGQWLGGFNANYSGTKVYNYLPHSGTAKIEIFFLTHAGANMKVYVDDVSLRAR